MRENEKIRIVGERVVLVPYCHKHVLKYHGWMLDPRLLELTASEPLSLEEEYEMQQSWRDDPKKCTFIVLSSSIEGNEIDQMIGDVNIFLNDDEDALRAELDIMIAESTSRGSGCGKEAVLLMLHYCFTHLNLIRFYCKINATNESSLKLFQKLGFVEVKFVAAFQEYEYVYNFENSESFREYFHNHLGRSVESIEYCQYDGDCDIN